MIDIHTHITPYIDDGADDTDEALEMLKKAANNGTERIILTPHFPNKKFGSERTALEYITFVKQAIERLNGEQDDIVLYSGAENYCGGNVLERLEAGEVIPLAGTSYILLEFPPECSFSFMREIISAFLEKGYRPVIAHVERYYCLQCAPERLLILKEEGCKLQVNADAVTSKDCNETRFAKFILGEGLADVMASDCHNVYSRSPDMSEANAEVCCGCSPEYADLIFSINPQKILSNEEF